MVTEQDSSCIGGSNACAPTSYNDSSCVDSVREHRRRVCLADAELTNLARPTIGPLLFQSPRAGQEQFFFLYWLKTATTKCCCTARQENLPNSTSRMLRDLYTWGKGLPFDICYNCSPPRYSLGLSFDIYLRLSVTRRQVMVVECRARVRR